MAKKKRLEYEVTEGQRCDGLPCFVLREKNKPGVVGYVAATWSRSKRDFEALTRLVEQANPTGEQALKKCIHCGHKSHTGEARNCQVRQRGKCVSRAA
jgi:hypothetical protein